MSQSDKELKAMCERGWRGGLSDGTECGRSSRVEYARTIMGWLPDICAEYRIKSICDAGAGDMHWIKLVSWPVDYQGFDLVPRHKDVKRLDITKKALPKCDAILCRMVLNHLDKERITKAIKLFKKSGKYLIATHFVGDNINRNREFTRLDLTEWLGKPLAVCEDGHEDNCRLAIWSL